MITHPSNGVIVQIVAVTIDPRLGINDVSRHKFSSFSRVNVSN